MVARQGSLILSTTWFHFVHIIWGQWLVKPVLSNNQGETDTKHLLAKVAILKTNQKSCFW